MPSPLHFARRCAAGGLLWICLSDALGAQVPTIPIRRLSAAEAVSADTITVLQSLRELSDGQLLVNESGRRRLLQFAPDLQSRLIIADTASGASQPYGPRVTAIMPFSGDSSLMVDADGRALLVIDPRGTVQRVMSLPRPEDAGALSTAGSGNAGLDAQGRLVYRVSLMPQFRPPVRGREFKPPTVPDSAPILRVDFDSRRADTVTWIRTARMKIHTEMLPNGGVRLTPVLSPISILDDWTLLPDGTVVVVRGSDYHLDWYAPTGTVRATGKMPFGWRRLSDEDKVAIIDSTRTALLRQADAADAAAKAAVGSGASPGSHGGAAAAGGGHSMTIMPIGESADAPPPQSSTKLPAAARISELVPASELPDYVPPVFRTGMMKVDDRGYIWLLPSTSAEVGRGLLYDVIDATGTIVERVRLPEGRALEGFGRSGAVYLSSHLPGGARLERVRVIRSGS